jgi:hypothetical protein
MILWTVPGMVTLGCSRIRDVSRFSSPILADLAMRGFAISLLTLARIALPDSFLVFLCGIHLSSHRETGRAVPFCTVAKYFRATNDDETGPRESGAYSCRTTLRSEVLIWSPPLYLMNPSFLNLFMKKFTRERVVPTISASISCDILGRTT